MTPSNPLARTASAACAVIAGLFLSTAVHAADTDLRLVEAAKARDLAAVEALIKLGVDVTTPQPDGATALHWAAHWNDVRIASLLIDKKAPVDAVNDFGVTPLLLACADAGGEMVDLLLKAGSDPNLAHPGGETPLMTAVRANNLPAVRPLLGRQTDVNAKETSHGQTALMWAFSRGYLDMARVLLDAGADIHAKSNGGFSPLLFAARTGSLEAVALLLSRGADVNEVAADGSSVLHVAVVRGHLPLVELLLDRGANPNASGPGYTPLHSAAGTWDSVTTHEFLSSPPQPHAVDDEWRSLVGLERQDKLRMVTSLLARGADPNAATTRLPPRFGWSFQSFIRVGGGSIGMTPFAIAAQAGDATMMRLLVAGGADPTIPTTDRTTPLMIAAGMTLIEEEMSTPEPKRLEAVQVALAVGNDVNAVNSLGNTALHGTAFLGFPTIAEYLVKQGAALSPLNKTGETPLRVAEGTIINAMFFIHDSVVKVLKQLGATSEGTGVCTPGIKERASVATTLCEDATAPAGAPAKP